jgi:hypothetical protein
MTKPEAARLAAYIFAQYGPTSKFVPPHDSAQNHIALLVQVIENFEIREIAGRN